MKKLFLYIIISNFILLHIFAQQPGKWQIHLSYHHATQSEPAGNLIYVLANGSLFAYDEEDTAIELYNKINYLNDTDISAIRYSSSYKTLLIAYSNGNIDLLVNNNEVYNLPDYKNKQLSYKKTINHIHFDNQYAYLSTQFGVLVINIDKKEITNTYILNKYIYGCTTDGDKLYATSKEGLYLGNLNDNLLDVNNWSKVSKYPFTQIHHYENQLIGNIYPDGFHTINKDQYNIKLVIKGNYTFSNIYNDKLLAGNNETVLVANNINDYTHIPLKTHAGNLKHISWSNNTYWGSYGKEGLIGQKLNTQTNSLEDVTHPIIPDSPVRNLTYRMTFAGNKLLIAGGGITLNRLDHPGTIMAMENNDWTNFSEDNITGQTKLPYMDITAVVQDPKDAAHYYASSAGEGMYEFKEGELINWYHLHNSPLQSALPDYEKKDRFVRVNGLVFDNHNNLWMLNSETGKGIHILKEDGTWISFDYPGETHKHNLEHSLIDRRGWFWATARNTSSSGILCLNTNQTIDNTNDDQYRFITEFTNQEDIQIKRTSIHSIAEDRNGVIWIGTGAGPILLTNPSRFFEDNFKCTQIKVPRNDGTGLADYLLINDAITAIAIDGANRKWLGTEGNGLFLLSEDGLETIHHFTENNSPLLSNSILSLAIQPRTGEVFIGTSKGLVSYQSDAVEPENSFAKETLEIYPNPVRPGFDGLITINGLVSDSDIKIIDVSGNVIHAGTSAGGRFTWDGKNRQGRRVATGVYYILAADSEGKTGIAGKIMVVR
ncbi:Por secretion system protein [Bacteroides sp. OttesenSCG-928-J23]|nr:Por secretion system protein [Bacteroides sp. OttesenSCG-928-J23]MDL2299569.1 Por secretion system protein [Bacteroides sp. OttesenSCG-928-E20]MDL2305018.1 Por secretion system protein [Bacteroides sp. OttesenSCG-928-D19]